MYISPYQTLACKSYNLNNILKAIKHANVSDELYFAGIGEMTMSGVLGIRPSARDVPLFAHPIIWNNGYGDFAVVDLRGFIREDRINEGTYKVTQASDHNFAVMRAALVLFTHQHGGADLLAMGDFPTLVFSRYFSENIVRRLGLNPEEQAFVSVLSAFYFLCLFKNRDEFTNEDRDKQIAKVARVTNIAAQWIYDRFEEIPFMENINDLIGAVKTFVPNNRVKDLSPALIFAMLGGGWFGTNGRETMAVALEHPATFLCMVYASLNDRSYRKAGLAKTVLDAEARHDGKTFLRNFESLIKSIGQ